ncbi:hypothetical protein TROLL_253 [Bacillus phage Troll]|uniref:Uncharacterized protein n=5 Tax=Caudoviricetes TaxID=2731619 RepID=A0A075M0I0_9CAUD|nr:hypothetical protein TROLL_253 [Bacillus phage Troll]YP_009056018.1 hypothetical protein LD11_gp253 [Bacillus phage Riley]YP_009206614.1 hypothetical protein AVV02_gp259 [Bacillus phage AvesoBmore]YP_009290130.1 hypothetical protein BI003_gp251 [Bacillus phage Phrodo]AMW61579.1 hypothetical protein JUGLONE_255 [Bacillus phage Juglone]QDH49950.1 hypothetical protein BEYONPHE_263 [Bacillus phage Beyonphe]UGO49062.1 hypothetical protein JARJAR_248 [Bacillus phage vB_BanH_JarJar]UGO50552.1 hy
MRARKFIYHVAYTVYTPSGRVGEGDCQYSIPKKRLTEPSIKKLNDFIKKQWKEGTGITATTVVINSYQLIRETRGYAR